MDDNVLSVNLKLGFDTFQFMFGKLSTYYLVAMDNATRGNNFWFEFLWFKSHIFPRDKHELEWRFRRKWEHILHILKLEAQTITFIKLTTTIMYRGLMNKF